MARWGALILQVILQFCSRFGLKHCSFTELDLATRDMRVEEYLPTLLGHEVGGRYVNAIGVSGGDRLEG